MFTQPKNFFRSSRFRITVWYTSLFLVLEILLGIVIYIYLYNSSYRNLDYALKIQAISIRHILEEKHIDIESFRPGELYKNEEELVWDIIYDVVVFNRRNTFIQISNKKKIVFKTGNLQNIILSFPDKASEEEIFDYYDSRLSGENIRVCLLQNGKYTIVVAYPKEFVKVTLDNLQEILLLITPIFLIISMIGGMLLSAKSLSRIDKVIKKTEEITASNLDEKIPGGEEDDEFGRLISKMNEMIQRIKTSLDFMNQFSVLAAHELKTPLTILRGEIELALRSEKPVEKYIEVLKSNHEETIRLIKIIDNLFFISRSDNKLVSLSSQKTELIPYLDQLITSLSMLGFEKRMGILLEAKTNPAVYLDPDLFKQAIFNLIDNAVKYGDPDTNITVSVSETDDYVNIEIENVGEKIPIEEREKIFDRFYRSVNSQNSKKSGVGLGLSVVKSIMTLHGGQVKVVSTNEKKNTILIQLPKPKESA